LRRGQINAALSAVLLFLCDIPAPLSWAKTQSDGKPIAVAALPVKGAGEDQARAINNAVRLALSWQRVSIAGDPKAARYIISGAFRPKPVRDGEESIQIDWRVTSADETDLLDLTGYLTVEDGSQNRKFAAHTLRGIEVWFSVRWMKEGSA
jgi:hypothetical protein